MTLKPTDPTAANIYNVVPDSGGWKIVKGEGERPLAILTDKADAVQRAKELAKKSPTTTRVRVHKKDGSLEIEYTYHKSVIPPPEPPAKRKI